MQRARSPSDDPRNDELKFINELREHAGTGKIRAAVFETWLIIRPATLVGNQMRSVYEDELQAGAYAARRRLDRPCRCSGYASAGGEAAPGLRDCRSRTRPHKSAGPRCLAQILGGSAKNDGGFRWSIFDKGRQGRER